jgi:hypothetical protein
LKIPKLQIVKQKTLKIHKSKSTPLLPPGPTYPLFTPKKENEDPKNDKKKIENLQKKFKKQKNPPKFTK